MAKDFFPPFLIDAKQRILIFLLCGFFFLPLSLPSPLQVYPQESRASPPAREISFARRRTVSEGGMLLHSPPHAARLAAMQRAREAEERGPQTPPPRVEADDIADHVVLTGTAMGSQSHTSTSAAAGERRRDGRVSVDDGRGAVGGAGSGTLSGSHDTLINALASAPSSAPPPPPNASIPSATYPVSGEWQEEEQEGGIPVYRRECKPWLCRWGKGRGSGMGEITVLFCVCGRICMLYLD